MSALPQSMTARDSDSERYAQCIIASKRVRWDIDQDVLRGRRFDVSQKFLPDSLAKIDGFATLSGPEKRFVSQIQGRTYANMFGLVERYINAKVMEVSRDHWFGDQTKLEALIRFSDEELKHQELFRRVEEMIAADMPDGYRFPHDPNEVANDVLGKSNWAVLGLTLLIELVTLVHYRESIDPDAELSPLYKDIFLFHWKEESQHAIMDELEWLRHDAAITLDIRDKGVDDLIALAGAVDGILQAQSEYDADYFRMACDRPVDEAEFASLRAAFLRAYRWQYILSGAQNPRFGQVLCSIVTKEQMARIQAAVSSLE